MTNAPHIPLNFTFRSIAEIDSRASAFAEQMASRRTVRDFSPTPVPRSVIESVLRTARSAPSGANQQPWHFVAVSNAEIKQKIRTAAEREEYEFYVNKRAGDEWLGALSHLGTDHHKPFLETAPWLIVVFGARYGIDANGERVKHYYTPESVGISMGMLITAVHQAGLASLTHTPAPMKFLNEILNRPDNESPYLILVVGYPAENCEVPAISRKPATETTSFIE
ncbi:MAG: nitroreductase family protein [Betaproteobacteria bacterium]|nr:MAG: nitroreductase family protein [Betaproteobacteria bacterium]